MAQIPFVGGSYTLPDRQWDYQRTVNMYPVMDESGLGKSMSALVSVPGLIEFCNMNMASEEDPTPDPTANVVRGMWVSAAGRVFIVHDANFGELLPDGTVNDIASLNTDSGPIQMASNGKQICIVDGEYGYIYTEEDNTFDQIPTTDESGWRGSETVTYIDSYFIFVEPNSQVVYLSQSYDGNSFNALDFASAEGSPDNILTASVNNGQLWLFGQTTTEVWVNTGNEFPFSRVPSGVLQYGCIAKQSVVNLSNSMFWVGRDQSSAGIVYMANGLNVTRISTEAVEFAISTYGDVSDATAFGYDMDGHPFYVINFPTAQTSWAYDLRTQQWHERQSMNLGESLGRARAEFHVVAFNKHLVSDYRIGKIYEMSRTAYTEDGNPLVRIRRSPHMASQTYKRLQFSSFQLDYSCGYGFDEKGYENPLYEKAPKCWLRWSNDGGFNWSNDHDMPLGKTGEYSHRAIWRRLGVARNRVWEIRCSDDTRFTILGANVEGQELGS